MLASLLNVPNDELAWQVWSFNNRAQNAEIRAAILKQKNVNLSEYPLDPIPFDDLTTWLAWNQQAHNDFNGVLGLQGNDLEGVNFEDAGQKQAWLYLNYQELYSASAALSI